MLTLQAIINAYNDRLYINVVKNAKAIVFLRGYYRRLGYVLDGPYMSKMLEVWTEEDERRFLA